MVNPKAISTITRDLEVWFFDKKNIALRDDT
jgi:hypothetical protein